MRFTWDHHPVKILSSQETQGNLEKDCEGALKLLPLPNCQLNAPEWPSCCHAEQKHHPAKPGLNSRPIDSWEWFGWFFLLFNLINLKSYNWKLRGFFFPSKSSLEGDLHSHSLTHSQWLTHSSWPEPRDGRWRPVHLPPRGGLEQVPIVSSTTSTPPRPALDNIQSMSSPSWTFTMKWAGINVSIL